MTGMTDMHCHVLPGVDDGARDIDEALDMLQIMYDEGIRSVIMTPHYHGGHMEPDVETIRLRFKELKEAAQGYDTLAAMDLYIGCEIYYYPSVVEWLDEGRVLTMAGSRYVLLEFGYSSDVRKIAEGVSRVAASGYYPIIAHIERYSKLVGDMNAVYDLTDRGAYIQINTEALSAGWRIRSFARKLLKNELVHFVGTDAHNMRGRIPRMMRESEYIRRRCGEEYCRELFIENPSKITASGLEGI